MFGWFASKRVAVCPICGCNLSESHYIDPDDPEGQVTHFVMCNQFICDLSCRTFKVTPCSYTLCGEPGEPLEQLWRKFRINPLNLPPVERWWQITRIRSNGRFEVFLKTMNSVRQRGGWKLCFRWLIGWKVD